MPYPTRSVRSLAALLLGALALTLAFGLVGTALAGDPQEPPSHADGHGAAHDSAAGHGHHEEIPATAPTHEGSLHHLEATWTDAHGDELRLREYAGHPVMITMFYGSCETACPILLHKARRLQEATGLDLPVLAVTFDPEADTPEALQRYAEERGYDRSDWRFLIGDELRIRMLATMLGVQYRPLQEGGFAHSNLIAVVDGDGVVVLREEGLAAEVEPIAEAIRVALGHDVAPGGP